MVALIDTEDLPLIEKHKWQAHKHGNKWYAVSGSPYSIIYMHRVILGLETGDKREVDHKNGIGLDNRKENIRIATRSQNSANKKPTGKFKGAHKNGERWRAQITVNYKKIHLGYFDTVEEAAKAYDDAAKEHFGEFAFTNDYT